MNDNDLLDLLYEADDAIASFLDVGDIGPNSKYARAYINGRGVQHNLRVAKDALRAKGAITTTEREFRQLFGEEITQ